MVLAAVSIGWLVGAYLFLRYDHDLPFAACFCFYVISKIGFRKSIAGIHCEWITIAGMIFGALIPATMDYRGGFSIQLELFGHCPGFGCLVNASLLFASLLMFTIATIEFRHTPEATD